MKEAAVKKALSELNEVILGPRSGKVTNGCKAPAPSGTVSESVEFALDEIRLQVKYLVFDVEATRRENGYLRRMLESRNKPEAGDDSSSGL